MKLGTKLIAALLITSAIIGSFGMASAAGSNYDTVYVGNATEMGVEENQTYDTIQNATNNVAENGSIEMQEGNYTLQEEVNITENNLTYSAYSGNVTLEVNTTSGYAFNASDVEEFSVGENVTVSGDVYAGGGGSTEESGSSLENEYYGIPLWGYLLGILALLGLLYEYGER